MTISSTAGRLFTFPALILTIVFTLAAAIGGHAQIQNAENAYGAIDPLLYDFGRHAPKIPLSAAELAPKQDFSNSPKLGAPVAGELDPTLNPLIDSYPGNVRSSALQPDGKILVGGYFKDLNGKSYKSIVRLNADYSIDPGFNASANGSVMAIALQTDGKIVIGGAFTVIDGKARNRIARLNLDGSLDNTFNAGAGADNIVYDIAIRPDGKIMLGGSFVFVGTSLSFYVARLNADGSLDSTFLSPIRPAGIGVPPSIVYGMALQPDGKVILGGYIVTNSNGFPPTATPVARLNPDGSFDPAFNPGTINSNLYDVALQPDGKILIGGFFNQINGTSRKYLARLNGDGSLDPSFDASAEATAPVWTIHLKSDGKILFSPIIMVPSTGAARQLNTDGSLDRAFIPQEIVTGQIYTLLSTADGKVFAGGSFSSPFGAVADTALLFNPDGSPDADFTLNSTALGGLRALAVQPDGKIIVAGNFNRAGGAGRNRLARFNADGSLDTTFNFDTNAFSANPISVLLLQPDGSILVGASYSTNETLSNALVRLKSDGTVDQNFVSAVPSGRATATALALQADGKILVAYVNQIPGGGTGGGLVRLNPNGSLDPTFTAPALQYEALAVLPDGKILAGGPSYIGYINSGTGESDFYYGVLRLEANGAHDRSFRAGLITDSGRFTSVYALSLGPDGKILVGGHLYTGGASEAYGILRLNASGTIDGAFEPSAISSSSEFARVEAIQTLPNGKLLVGGFFNNLGASPQKNIARLTADGGVDESFHAETDDTVYDIKTQGANKILIGGDFEKVNNTARTSLARLIDQPFGARRAPFDFDGDGKTDIGIFRPSDGSWWYSRSSDNAFRVFAFGTADDIITPGDFTGDGKTDIGVFRPASGEWVIQRSEDQTYFSFPFGSSGDIPSPADFDGDGKTDAAVYRPASGTWYILNSNGSGTSIVNFGTAEDKPVAADFDGDGRGDIAIFRPSDGSWWYLRSIDLQFRVFRFGVGTDRPVQGDYTGDGKADIAVFRPETGEWFVQRSEDNSFYSVPFGTAGDLAAPGDYDGDGKFDTAVFRPATAEWYIQRTTAGILITTFGSNGDRPLPGAFVP